MTHKLKKWHVPNKDLNHCNVKILIDVICESSFTYGGQNLLIVLIHCSLAEYVTQTLAEKIITVSIIFFLKVFPNRDRSPIFFIFNLSLPQITICSLRCFLFYVVWL